MLLTKMRHLGTLAVTTENDLRVRTLARSLFKQLCSVRGSSFVTSLKVAYDTGWVRNTLHSNIIRTNGLIQSVEERWADERADVTKLNSTASEDDSDRLAFGKLVAIVRPVVLAFAEWVMWAITEGSA